MELPMPGTLLLVRGRRRGWLGRRESLIAQMLTSEPTFNIAHVALLWEPPTVDWLAVEIGFIPVLKADLAKSIEEIIGPRPVSTDWWSAQQEWRAQKELGKTGAFILDMSEIRSSAWETVNEHNPAATRDDTYLEYAFPMAIGEERGLRGVRVVGLPRIPPIPKE
jgi:hypothetical protein